MTENRRVPFKLLFNIFKTKFSFSGIGLAFIVLPLFVFILLIVGCSGTSESAKPPPAAVASLADRVFSFGPSIDSVNVEALAECDCCGSETLFRKDSSFIAIFYCLEGDSYVKGRYTLLSDKLVLRYDPQEITRINDTDAMYDSLAYQKTQAFQVVNRTIPESAFTISFLKSKVILAATDEDIYFGTESKSQTPSAFLDRLRKDSALYYLKTN
jgi:hypothetical protein